MTHSWILTVSLLFVLGSEMPTRNAGTSQEETPKAPAESDDEQSSKLHGDSLIEVEKQKTLPHKGMQALGTRGYGPSKTEEAHLKKLKPEDLITGHILAAYDIKDRVGQQVSWFGIVRKDRFVGDGKGKKFRHHELTVEHKFFDGLTDLHQLIVSFGGGGDFKVILPFTEKKLPFKTLTLVRFYGEVVSEKDGVPTLKVKFARVWPWNNFAFMGLGSKKNPDRTNAAWRKGLEIPENVYSSAPDTSYYEMLLGKRKK
jgi:hypothetical protein